ncbi:MAG: response regulator [Flavobacterium sp.]|uniref:response regulator n=1 Tax=Flavobacterium sp. TaxID=239 RepID=UPI0012232414|nr:response regulator [Flavobacterium sp.]RZJ63333.1 MAG: response regulator [Flavobacterium sp.]
MFTEPKSPKIIFLSDDDTDDCSLFKEALHEVQSEANLTIVSDGVRLMQALADSEPEKPEVIFLDLNMPRKNGFECLEEIRKSPKFMDIPVVIFSTSTNADVVDRTFNQGANLYITKPASYSSLKKTLAFVFSIGEQLRERPAREKFVVRVA